MYVLDPSSVKAGGTLTVSAQEATCDPSYGTDAQVQIDLKDAQGNVLQSELAPMSDAGAFQHNLTVPAGTKPGNYGVSATPHNLDWCDDAGKNNRIDNPGYGDTGLLLHRASCAIPFVPVHVTK